MTHMERFLENDIWKSCDTFTVTQVCQQLGIPRSVVLDILNRLKPELSVSQGAQQKMIYRRTGNGQKLLRAKWDKHLPSKLGVEA